MKIHTYPTVEDYLEVINGSRDPVTGRVHNAWLGEPTPIINLAKYDVDVLSNMVANSQIGIALTERQSLLALRIILKYKRQLLLRAVDVTPLETAPRYRLSLRQLDYRRSLSIIDDQLIVKFPYNSIMVEELRQFKKISQGACEWVPDKKHWHLALTEFNLSWAHAWSQLHQLTVDSEAQALFGLITAAELTPHAIELSIQHELPVISNCPSSMHAYLQERVGAFTLDKLQQLVDLSGECGYTVSQEISDSITIEHGDTFMQLTKYVEVTMEPSDVNFLCAINYAMRMGRYPVVIHDPSGHSSGHRLLNLLYECVPSGDVSYLSGENKDIQGFKFIYTTKPFKQLEYTPLLISTAGMIFGANYQTMIQRAGKVVFLVHSVYTKGSGKAVKIAS
jgi:hypothetical protein